mmetsp:Transcript_8717/g.12609  ORF Transcript_8717/g.12609 Transcript_8717/m.12609 type:complete len:364 (+) Transcript_8717:76-1167(+)
MPLTGLSPGIGKVRVDVGLCGALPRPCPSSSSDLDEAVPPTTPSLIRLQKLSVVTSYTSESLENFDQSCFAIHNGQELPTQACRCTNTSPTVDSSGESLFSSTNSFDTISSNEDNFIGSKQTSHLPMLDPPRWAVPARGGTRLEPVCEAIGSHPTIDLASKACFRVGRSPTSDVQLLHNTSSRRHAIIVHHANGGCYVVDCGSSHGTFVNGVRVRSTPSGSMVIPHRVKRGSLIRFGGPGAPTFVLKSFSVGFSAMVKEIESPISLQSLNSSSAAASQGNSRQPHEGGILKKRSFDEGPAQESKRQRCISPSSTMLEGGPIRLVSPESPRKRKRVSFHEQPEAFYPVLVTPDVLSSDEDDARS